MLNNLNSRERTLAIIVLCFVPLGGLYYGWTKYRGMRVERQTKILESIGRVDSLKNLSLMAQTELYRYDDAYNDASLPLSVADDTTLYLNFIENLINKSGLERGTIGQIKPPVDEFVEKTVGLKKEKETVLTRVVIPDIRVTGKLDQLMDFLYNFHDLAILHNIDRITISLDSPDKEDDNKLSVIFTVSAAILPSGPDTKDWSEYATGRLGKSRQAFENLIVARHVFGPPNVAPQLSSTQIRDQDVGGSLSFKISATDKNADDRLTFELLSDGGLAGVRLNQTGREATLTSSRLTTTGTFPIKVRVSDNRIPNLSDERTYRVIVKQPTPPTPERKAEPTPPPKYAQDTRITSTLQNKDGGSVVIIRNTTLDREYRVQVGDSFELDQKTWTVVQVVWTGSKSDPVRVTLRVGEELREYKVGEALENKLKSTPASTRTLTSSDSSGRQPAQPRNSSRTDSFRRERN